MQGSEVEWVRRAQAGDPEAFELLVLAHQRFVYNLALRGVGHPQEAEDVAQEAFVRAWLGLPGFRAEAQFRTWLYRIVVNLCYNRLPRLRQEVANLLVDEREDLPDEPGREPSRSLEASQQRAFLQEQIQSLSDGYRMMVLLRYQQDLSYEEISQVMDLPLGTVKTGLHRAHRQLRQALQTYEEAPV